MQSFRRETARSVSLRRLLAVSALGLALSLINIAAFARATDKAAKPASTAKAASAAKSVENISAPVKTYGSKNAPITLEVFGDYECPSCGAFYETTLRQMINNEVAAGKVYIVHRDFPLTMHKYGYEAARWANAAASIGRFAEAESALYDNQNYWAESGNIEKYMAAALSPADMRRVKALMAGCDASVPPGSHSCPWDAYIEQDRALGNQIPVQATPTFLIYYKGQKFPAGQGVVSYTVLKQFFDQLLKQ
ncbi:MAG TPA: thioredoxin domain-containing protein [Candidatus Acidoferrales bacterium]|jgi:protein-disulfide isomerase|nr:thioredoxin domain-containing protein [Candidatus Acidoferrales bacterium]